MKLDGRTVMTPAELLAAATLLASSYPDVLLAKNPVGNLAILTQDGEYLGFLDLRNGEIELGEDL